VFSDAEKEAIKRSWRLVIPIAETAADLFYRRLFELEPRYRQLFPADLSAQKRKLVRMLAFIVKSVDWAQSEWRDDVDPSEDLMLVVLALGRRHSQLYKIPSESYETVGNALFWTLEQGLGNALTPDVRDAWGRLYGLLAQTMQMGSVAEEEASLASAVQAQAVAEAALVAQLAHAGIDEARLGLSEDLS
jgi:hemoglobin-like flavoprotein